jgi:hypothetical protein
MQSGVETVALQRIMDIDNRFPIKLERLDDVPEPFRRALKENIPAEQSVRLLVYAPAFTSADELSPETMMTGPPTIFASATVLAVVDNGWLVATEEENSVEVEKCSFSDTLFVELTSILLSGELKIYFASVGTCYPAVIQFNTVGESLYREATGLILDGIDETVALPEADVVTGFETWPMKFRLEAERYRPKGRRLLAATQWPAVAGGFERELSPAGALLVTERELVLISEQKASPRQHFGDLHKFGGIITYFPLLRLSDFHISHHGRFGVFALQVHATHGGETLEFVFPAYREKSVVKAMQRALADKI